MLHSPCRRCQAGGRHASRICSAAGPHGPPVLGGERTVRAYHGLAQVLSSDVRSRPFPATLCLAMLSLQRELSLAPYCQTMLVFHLNNLFLPKKILLLEKNASQSRFLFPRWTSCLSHRPQGHRWFPEFKSFQFKTQTRTVLAHCAREPCPHAHHLTLSREQHPSSSQPPLTSLSTEPSRPRDLRTQPSVTAELLRCNCLAFQKGPQQPEQTSGPAEGTV